ncbi:MULTISPECIES: phosphatase PAP2 family protein [unclassified Agarivorans]|uniref:phosphatase PAP2 family protein n=1 Tax=unclassified Agarivorans TaxID=2636026 RepID=UPI003D7DB5A9
MKFSSSNKPLFKLSTIALAVSLLSACNNDSDTAVTITEPAQPRGVGFEQYVAIPDVSDPLPSVAYIPRSDGNGRFTLSSNPINTLLSGINDVWKGTTDHWQEYAKDYTDADNGYKAGDGPNPHNAANGQPSDYVAAGSEIKDPATWQANIKYVVDVTAQRTEQQTLYAFLDDIRSKNYSTIDGFGPLTEDYAANSGAFASFQEILVSDVTDNTRYKPGDNDSFSTYGGLADSTLGDVVKLAQLFRNSYASTSGPKYLFGTPRPWRMNDQGETDFITVETFSCIDGSSASRANADYRIDKYTTSVKVIPGLFCARRAHSSSHEADSLYTPTTENRRKDNGYPSGHTNAGILASLAYAYALPERFDALVARGSDLGENRILAGMHSPIDVIGGRVQAMMIASFALNTQPDVAAAAFNKTRDYFGGKATAASMSLYDYANQTVTNEGSFKNDDGTLNVNVFNNNRYRDHQALKDAYTFRLTYGLPQTGTKGLAPIVPEGAEALLATRQPYLSDAQRRAVLASTEVDSGYPMLDKTNGWGRINLVAAADGYGAFDGDVHVTMVRSEGGFAAQDWWRNDISGEGMLSKDGTGQLNLSGNNSYSGGTLLLGGVLTAQSPTAFGQGDLYLSSGEVQVDSRGALEIDGDFTQKSGVLKLVLDADAEQIKIAGVAYVNQGNIQLEAGQQALKAGDSFTLINAAKGLKGEYATASLAGHSVTLEYTANSVIAHINE